MNNSCQDEVDLVFHPAFQVMAIASVISSFAAYVFMALFFKKYAFKLYWHLSIKILFFFNMVISFLLATTVIVNFCGLWYRMYMKSVNCQVVLQLEHCVLLRWIFLGSFCLISLNHAAMVIERLWATIRLSKYEKTSGVLGLILLCSIVAIAFTVVYFIMIPEDYNEYVPTCLSFSATSIGNNIYILFTTQCFVEFFILAAQKFLLWFNQRRFKRVKLAEKTLSKRFQLNENLAVLEQLNPLIFTCSLVIGGYNIVAIIIRPFRVYFTKNNYIIIAFAIFIIPYLPFLLTYTAYHMLLKQLKQRQESTKNVVEINIIGNAQFTNDCYNWDSVYLSKYSHLSVKKSPWWRRNKVESHK